MRPIATSIIAALVVAGAAAVASAASADVVCNADNVCWHVHKHYDYRPEFGVTVHPDSWKWGPDDHYNWKEHSGRGYWRNGVWIVF